jgi:hypothetical protein
MHLKRQADEKVFGVVLKFSIVLKQNQIVNYLIESSKRSRIRTEHNNFFY